MKLLGRFALGLGHARAATERTKELHRLVVVGISALSWELLLGNVAETDASVLLSSTLVVLLQEFVARLACCEPFLANWVLNLVSITGEASHRILAILANERKLLATGLEDRARLPLRDNLRSRCLLSYGSLGICHSFFSSDEQGKHRKNEAEAIQEL